MSFNPEYVKQLQADLLSANSRIEELQKREAMLTKTLQELEFGDNDEEILGLAIKHGVDGCLTHNVKLLAFSKDIADLQREKCVVILEAEKVDYASTKDLGDLAYNTALDHGIAAIRANKESDEATIYDKINEGRI